MTLEEIGRRAVALTEARAAVERCEHVAAKSPLDDYVEGPCYIEMLDDPDDWCAPCKAHAEQVKARQNASWRLSNAIRTYRAQRDREIAAAALEAMERRPDDQQQDDGEQAEEAYGAFVYDRGGGR